MNSLPTIGIEIELPWRTIMRRVDSEAADILQDSGGFFALESLERQRVQQGFDAVDVQYKDLVAGCFGDDIAEKHDGYREFAFNPKHHHQDITEVARGLYEKGVLQDGEVYPLHVTLGGLSAKKGSWAVLMAAELSGGASGARMRQIGTWSQKGEAGIRQRSARELSLGASVAIEMRSLEARSLSQLGHVLQVAQTAGGVLLHKLSGDTARAKQWHELRSCMVEAAEQKDIDARVKWPNPQICRTPWTQIAAALDDSQWSQSVSADINTILLGR